MKNKQRYSIVWSKDNKEIYESEDMTDEEYKVFLVMQALKVSEFTGNYSIDMVDGEITKVKQTPNPDFYDVKA